MLKNLTANERVASKRGILIALFITVLAVNAVMGQQRSSSTSTTSNRSAQQSANDATVVFRAARDLITDGEWARAQAKFDEYVKAFPNEKNIEAALYWLAYTQQKLAKYDQVRATIDRLLQQYPNTNWKEDARMLLAQQPGVYIQDYPVAGVPTIVAQTPAPAFEKSTRMYLILRCSGMEFAS